MKTLCLLFSLLVLAGCSTHPDSLLLVKRDVELVNFVQYAPNWPPATLAVALNFEGNAPFAAIANEGRQAQFRCRALGAASSPLTEIEFGRVFFVGSAVPPENRTPLIPGELSRQGERYRYKAVLYPGLKARVEINGPDDFDLLTRDYDRIQCQLVGVTMLGGFMYSNELVISRSELVELHERNAKK